MVGLGGLDQLRDRGRGWPGDLKAVLLGSLRAGLGPRTSLTAMGLE